MSGQPKILKSKIIVGQKFQLLTAVKRIENRNRLTFWLFRCDCGKEVERRLRDVVRNTKNSCGCVHPKFKDKTGQKFGMLEAIKYVGRKNNRSIWLFRCDCGKEKELVFTNVSIGTVVSCGCYKKIWAENKRKDLSGLRIGNVTIIKTVGKKEYKNAGFIWECLCDCGKLFNVYNSYLNELLKKKDTYYSCGCKIGYSPEKSHRWKGGRLERGQQGYVLVRADNHPQAKKGYIFEHRLVMEKIIGRYLLPHPLETVHHKNAIRNDNRPENLELWVGSQPAGARAEDLVSFAREILKTYGDLFPE